MCIFFFSPFHMMDCRSISCQCIRCVSQCVCVCAGLMLRGGGSGKEGRKTSTKKKKQRKGRRTLSLSPTPHDMETRNQSRGQEARNLDKRERTRTTSKSVGSFLFLSLSLAFWILSLIDLTKQNEMKLPAITITTKEISPGQLGKGGGKERKGEGKNMAHELFMSNDSIRAINEGKVYQPECRQRGNQSLPQNLIHKRRTMDMSFLVKRRQ